MQHAHPSSLALPVHIQAIIADRSWLNSARPSVSLKYVVGIDYGTTFSGFGIVSLNDQSTLSLARHAGGLLIRTYDLWDMQPPGMFSSKLPSISTYSRPAVSARGTDPTTTPESPKLQSWGWPASADISGKNHKLALTKLALHPDTPPHQQPMIPPGLDLVHVIADYLAELVKVIRYLEPNVTDIDGETVWCFTVPVNWNASAMDTMRHAAHRAGVISSPYSPMLRFCEEPEAAALTCLEESGARMQPGSKFLVVDAGGGTVDLFMCKVDHQNATTLDEITVGQGDFLGASFIDARFYAFVRAQLGDDTWESLTTNPSLANSWRDVEVKWENLKRTYRGPSADGDQHETLSFSLTLYKLIPPEFKAKLLQVQGTDDELWISSADMQSFFDPVVSQITDLVRAQLADTTVDYLFFVGGFGGNKYLQTVVMADKDVAKHVRTTIMLRQPESAVLKGAVRYGMNQGRIRTRMAKHTLALLVHVNQTGSAADQNLITIGTQSFLILVRRGDPVHFDSLVTHSHLALGDTSSTGVVKIFEINQTPNMTSPRLVCRVTVSAPVTPGIKRRVTLLVNFGELELKLRAVSEVDGREWRVSVNYDITQVTWPPTTSGLVPHLAMSPISTPPPPAFPPTAYPPPSVYPSNNSVYPPPHSLYPPYPDNTGCASLRSASLPYSPPNGTFWTGPMPQQTGSSSAGRPLTFPYPPNPQEKIMQNSRHTFPNLTQLQLVLDDEAAGRPPSRVSSPGPPPRPTHSPPHVVPHHFSRR